MTLGCSQSIELMSRASWCNRKVTRALWSHISLQKPSNSTKINEWKVLWHIWGLGETVPPKRKSDIFVVKTCRMVLKLSESIVLPVSNLGSDFKSTYLRAPKELDDKIADSERSPRVYFLVSIWSKNIYGARRKSILKFTSFELKEPTFKTGIAFTEILDPCFVRIPVRVADSKLLCVFSNKTDSTEKANA